MRLVREAGLRETAVETPTPAAPPMWIESRGASGPLAWLRAVGFWLGEYARVRRGAPCGEEILVVAERPAA